MAIRTRSQPELCIGILAAGESKRLGKPKQLIDIQGQPLLNYIAQQANATGLPVAVVLGAHADKIKTKTSLDAQLVTNLNWSQGMASSLHCLISEVTAQAWLIMTVDQYRVTTDILNTLIARWRASDKKTIIVSEYENTLGVPAIIPAIYREQLLALTGDQGAGRFIRQLKTESPDAVESVVNEQAAFDIDIPSAEQECKSYFLTLETIGVKHD